jgi:hypothetical protein
MSFGSSGASAASSPTNGTTLDLAIRTSRLFRRASTGVGASPHRHGSIDDPDMLARDQAAVGRTAS